MPQNLLIAISCIFNIVGLFLITSKSFSFILGYSAFAILLIAVVVFLGEKSFSFKLVRTFFLIAGFGFLVEVIGVKYGLPFGEYFYGDNLGFKLWQVPLVIGLNWVLLIYMSVNSAKLFFKNKLAQALFAALLMLVIDFSIEPIAASLDFWYWLNLDAGFLNYLSWFLISVFLSLFYLSRHEVKLNRIAIAHYFIYLGFFIVLNFVF